MTDATEKALQMAHAIDAAKMLAAMSLDLGDHSVRCYTRKDAERFIRHAYHNGALDAFADQEKDTQSPPNMKPRGNCWRNIHRYFAPAKTARITKTRGRLPPTKRFSPPSPKP